MDSDGAIDLIENAACGVVAEIIVGGFGLKFDYGDRWKRRSKETCRSLIS